MEKMNNNRARSFMQVRSSRSRSRNKRGVSPVIGVILMVAATIVIAGVVMGMLGGFKAPGVSKTVGISTSRINETHVDITLTAIEPAGTDISSINCTAGCSGGNNNVTSPSVGSTWTINTTGSTPPVHVVLTAYFKDGSTQVVFDSKV